MLFIIIFIIGSILLDSILFILEQDEIIPNIIYSNILGQQVSSLEAINFTAISLQLMGILCLFLYFKDKLKKE